MANLMSSERMAQNSIKELFSIAEDFGVPAPRRQDMVEQIIGALRNQISTCDSARLEEVLRAKLRETQPR